MGIDLKKSINVLIPDGESILTLPVIRCLSGEDHVNIHLVSSKKWIESRFSRHVDSFTYCPEYSCEADFIDFITELVQKKKIDVLLPVHLPAISLLSKHKSRLKEIGIHFIAADTLDLETANNKGSLAQLLQEQDIPHPKTRELLSVKDHKLLEYPLLLKPVNGWNGNEILIVKGEKEFLETTSSLKDKGDYIVQNYISGYDIDMSVIGLHGQILSYTIQKGYLNSQKAFEPPQGIEFMDNKAIFKVVEQLISSLNWSGVAHIDLRYDEIMDEFVIIEVNPRFWGSVGASKKMGVNFPYLYCQLSLGMVCQRQNFKFEKYANNRGFISILKSRVSFGKSIGLPDSTSLTDDIVDPFPKAFKYLRKLVLKLFPIKKKEHIEAIISE